MSTPQKPNPHGARAVRARMAKGQPVLHVPQVPNHVFGTILVALAILTGMSILVFLEVNSQQGLGEDYSAQMLDPSQVDLSHVKEPAPTECLIIYDSSLANSRTMLATYEQTLVEMRVGFDTADLSQAEPSPAGYRTAILLTDNFASAEPLMPKLRPWVSQGGNLLVGSPLWNTGELGAYADLLGIEPQEGYDLFDPKTFVPSQDFMVGGAKPYNLPGKPTGSMLVRLATAKAEATDTADHPLVWRNAYGKGSVVVANVSIWAKAGRGIYAQAYSLLGGGMAFPVIDAQTYFLDDCPSPTPDGTSEYVERDYHMPVSQFYSMVWWPSMNRLAEKHDLTYTGALIEVYDSRTDGTFERPKTASAHRDAGNMLLSHDGELALHGYNHQPLVTQKDFYTTDYGYDTWKNQKALGDSLIELRAFSEAYFPQANPVVYVPPSNVLAPEGRTALARDGGVRAICSIYEPGQDAYDQEFTVADDGIVEAPRITSGEFVEEGKFSELSELNLHYVATHFVQPDDALDEDRGAKKGWAAMEAALDDYMTWVDACAPNIRHLTASGLAGAVQRYATVTPVVTMKKDVIDIRIDGYVDDARLFVRINDAKPGQVRGGVLRRVAGSLYLLDANDGHVTIQREAS